MNLSDAISKDIKNILPRYIKVHHLETANNEPIVDDIQYSIKQKEKQKLIREIKEASKKGKSQREIAKEYGLDRKTISKYIKVIDIKSTSTYDISNRFFSYLDPYKNEIINLYNKSKNISSVYRILKDKGISVTYSTLRKYIAKLKLADKSKNEITIKEQIKRINRGQIIRYILNWKYDKTINLYIDKLIKTYPSIKLYKVFYQQFKKLLTTLDTIKFIRLISFDYKDKCLNNFIKSLNKDYKAVINAATYNISNGILEGTVNKIKQIKRDMYGRASYNLLRKKVIYQSLFS